MNVLVAPQGFKGSLDAVDVAHAIARGVRQIFVDAQITVLPIADGGEGTVRALVAARGGRLVVTRATGPLGRPVNAAWGLLSDGETAVIEMAAASGLPLIRRDERNPLRTTSFGTGELICHAMDAGARHLIVGIGGSATNDGGAGMLEALGARFLDRHGRELPRGGGALGALDRLDLAGLDPRLRHLHVEVACDVNNPLTGPTGASHVYGPQKGATPEMARELDAALQRYAEILRRDLHRDVAGVPGAGAAGGVGAALLAFLNARLRPGVDLIFEAMNIDAHLSTTDLVITGEGRLDRQDIFGKAPLGIAKRAHSRGIPCIVVAGSTGRDYQVVYDHGVDAVIGTVNRPMPLDRAIAEGPKLVTEAAMRACRLLRVGMRLGDARRQ